MNATLKHNLLVIAAIFGLVFGIMGADALGQHLQHQRIAEARQ